MPSKEELKKELHNLIDSIDDADTLNILHEEVAAYAKQEQDADEHELTNEQWVKVQHAMQQVKEGKTITLDELYTKMRSWRTQ